LFTNLRDSTLVAGFCEAVGAGRGKLLIPERRRRAGVVLQDRFQVSQRRACRLAGQNRTSQRWPVPVVGIEEQKLRRRIRELAQRHVRWGRRLVYRRLQLEGWSANHKRVQRIWQVKGSSGPCRAGASAPALLTGARRCYEPTIHTTCLRTFQDETIRFQQNPVLQPLGRPHASAVRWRCSHRLESE
jgi:hypothetical protein